MPVSPRNSPRATAKRQMPSSIAVVKRRDASVMEQAFCRIRLFVMMFFLLAIGQISLSCNLYIMTTIENDDASSTSSDPADSSTLVRLAAVELKNGNNHRSIRNVWGHEAREEKTMDKIHGQRRALAARPVERKPAIGANMALPRAHNHVLAKDMEVYSLEYFTKAQKDSRTSLPKDWPMGVLSEKPASFFREIQRRIDEQDPATRCSRYEGMSYVPGNTRQRRIFFGSLIANEPWELVEIVATEAHGIFEGVVLVESNRTQTFEPRTFQRLHQGNVLREAFGTSQVQVRAFVNESHKITSMSREHMQREEILKGWKEMGMGPDDIGYLGDLDETFTRDFLRAVQTCNVDLLDYNSHKCENAKILSDARVFEGSPECISEKGWWQ
jgi:Glycosyltransferase family 17